MAIDVADDKMEESEDKESILGEDLMNPFTGDSLAASSLDSALGLVWTHQSAETWYSLAS
jgi:hypothetical protein